MAVGTRVVLESILLKHLKSIADEDTVEEICKNPYLQNFLGYDSYWHDPQFSPSLFVTIRRRLGDVQFDDIIRELVSYTAKVKAKLKEQSRGKNRDSNPTSNDEGKNESRGHSTVDATIAPSDIK